MIREPLDGEIWAMDTEWGFRDSRVDEESAWEPVVLCLVGLRHGRRLSFWGNDPALQAFFATHAGDTFIAHYAIAEMKYLLRLGAPIPERWYDTFGGYRWWTNRPNPPEAGLIAALHQLGLPGLAPAAKKELRRKILHLRFDPHSPRDRQEIIAYCFSDCDGCAALYSRIHSRSPRQHMQHWCEFLKGVARMELRGVPYDMALYDKIQLSRPALKKRLIARVNSSVKVYEGDTFKRAIFLAWCRRVGIDWPVTISKTTGRPTYSLDKKTMKQMEGRHPFIAELRQARKTLQQFQQRSMTVDRVTGRHHFSTSVFRSVTGRNQPRNFVFSGPKWLRYLIVPESPDHVLVFVDYVAQEIGIAAALSGDPAMRAVYEADDCHMAFAIRAGAASPEATRETHPQVRKRYKTVNLGVLYGQTAYGMAAVLGVPESDAEGLLAAHKALFPQYWRWSERTVQAAYDRGHILTPCGWRSRVPFMSNERTWMNWPMQAAGSDIMRLTVIYLGRQNVRLLAIVHDGFLLSCRKDQLDDLRAAVDYANGMAVEHVLPGFPLRWRFTRYENGRFEDEDGLPLWELMNELLEEVGA